MKAFLLALQFLTVAMPQKKLVADEQDFLRSRAWYSVVGALLGLVLAMVAWLLSGILPNMALAALLVVLWGLSSRFLHLDGLADTADAFGTTSERERALEIMKDTMTGSYGLAAVCCDLLLKFAILASLHGPALLAALICAPALARAVPVFISGLLPPARYFGLGKAISGGRGLNKELACGASALFIAVLFGGLTGTVAALLVALVGLGLGIWFHRRIRGFTGDTLGASIEICEIAALLAFAAL